MSNNILSCPLRPDGWISFRLVDEAGNGAPYAYLNYVLINIALLIKE